MRKVGVVVIQIVKSAKDFYTYGSCMNFWHFTVTLF